MCRCGSPGTASSSGWGRLAAVMYEDFELTELFVRGGAYRRSLGGHAEGLWRVNHVLALVRALL